MRADRRRLPPRASSLVWTQMCLVLVGGSCVGRAEPEVDEALANRPNVLLIVTDDQRGGLRFMPHTRTVFADQGRRFPHSFTTIPVCCPARASIFTGQYMHNHGVVDNRAARRLVVESTIQHDLQEAGYRTAIFGKYLNGVDGNPPYFHEWATHISGARYYGVWNVNGDVGPVNTYSTDYIAERAIEFLRTMDESDDDRPWFLYLPLSGPHAPFTPAPRHKDSGIPDWNGNAATQESDRSDKPRYVRSRPPSSSGLSIRPKQFRALLSVDDLVDEVFGALNELSEDRRTLAWFTSDNGLMWGEHALLGKEVPYDGSIRVPLLMRWPGRVTFGSVDRRMVGNIDIAPTVLAAAGLSRPMDGRSLLDDSWRRRELLIEFAHQRKTGDPPSPSPPSWASLRGHDYQYTEYYSQGGHHVIAREYYDLVSDPWQLHNLLARTTRREVDVQALSKRLAHARSCKRRSCP